MPYQASDSEFYSGFYAQEEHPSLASIRQRHEAVRAGFWHADEGEDCWRLHRDNMQILKAPKKDTPYAEYWPDIEEADMLVCAYSDVDTLINMLDEIKSVLKYYAHGDHDGGARALHALETLLKEE